MKWFIPVKAYTAQETGLCAAEMVQSRSHVAIALDPCVICHDDPRFKSGSLCCADSLSDMDAPNVIPAHRRIHNMLCIGLCSSCTIALSRLSQFCVLYFSFYCDCYSQMCTLPHIRICFNHLFNLWCRPLIHHLCHKFTSFD